MSSDTDKSRVIGGRYSLDAQIGRGGMGVVWRGEDRMLGRTVALKRVGMVPGGAAPDMVRAEREARLAARLNHAHIVAIFDLVTDGDSQWLVMEYVEGRTLSQWVSDEGPLDPEDARRTLAQATDALAAAHAAGILHRDVKPSNILIRHDGGVKLTDFGIARGDTDATLTQTGLVSGSPAYLAPEVASGGRAGAASDVWALGATLYHALEGHPPYDMGGNVVAGMYQIVHGPEPRSDKAGPLAVVLEHTLVKDPEQRWSMQEVRDALNDPARLDEVARRSAATAPLATGPEATQTAETVAAPAAALADGDAAGASAEAPPARIAPPPSSSPRPPRPPRPSRSKGERSGRRRGLLLAGLAVVLLLAAGIGLALSLSGGEDPGDAAADPGAGETSAEPDEPTPTPDESPSESATGSPAASQRQFIRDYLAASTSDPSASWEMLTPSFQEASGGFEAYEDFWSGFTAASVSDITADPESNQISYTVSYERAGGGTTSPETVTLQLVDSDGRWLIADEF